MPIRDEDSFRARVVQIVVLILNFMGIILAVFTFSLSVQEIDGDALDISHFTKRRFDKQKPTTNQQKEINMATLTIVSVYMAITLAVIMLLFTMVVMVVTVVEHRTPMIVMVILCGLLTSFSLICAIMLFISKVQSGTVMDEIFKTGVDLYNDTSNPNWYQFSQYIDRTQHMFECCGYKGYGDYKGKFDAFKLSNDSTHVWKSCIMKSGLTEIPFTCCKAYKTTNDMLYTDCVLNVFHNDVSCLSAVQKTQIPAPERIHIKGCEGEFTNLFFSLDVLTGLYLTHFVFSMALTVLTFLLTREVVDKKQLILPPVRELKQMGFGAETMHVLIKNADEIGSESGKGGESSGSRSESVTRTGTIAPTVTRAGTMARR